MAKLGDYVKIRTGKLDANASSESGQYPFFTCAIEPLKIDSYSYDCECVLVAGNGDLNVKYYSGKFDAYQRTYIIESMDKTFLDVQYLYFFMDKYLETLRSQSIGGVIKYIKLGNLTEADIFIPSIEGQREIVQILRKSRKLISLRKQQLAKLDELVKARFVEMFGNPASNTMGWKSEQLVDCLQGIDNGKSFVCSNDTRQGQEPAMLKLSAVTYGVYNQKENKVLLDDTMFIKAAEVHRGDLLFTRKNTPELVGMCAYVTNTEPNLMMPDLIFRLNPNDKINAIFLWKLINHELFREKIQNIATGSAKSMSNISKERLGKLKIIVPPIPLQNQFATFVERVDKQKQTVQQSLEKLELMKKALMQEYFG